MILGCWLLVMMRLLDRVVVDRLASRAYAVDYVSGEVLVSYKDCKSVLARVFHIPKHLQVRILRECDREGLICIINKNVVRIKQI